MVHIASSSLHPSQISVPLLGGVNQARGVNNHDVVMVESEDTGGADMGRVLLDILCSGIYYQRWESGDFAVLFPVE